MSRRTPTLEHFLYLVLFLVALGARLIQLGATPLSDVEASVALRALEASQNPAASLGSQPFYAVFTGLLFFLFDNSNFLARFWPALAGSLLVLLPLGLRRYLPPAAGLVFALGVALDPGLVAASRLAGGPMLALTFALFAICFHLNASPTAAGIFAGLALLGGPAIWMGVLGLALAFGLARVIGIFPGEGIPGEARPPENSRISPSMRSSLVAAGITLLLAGTLFLRYPQGIGSLAASLPDFLLGWRTPGAAVTRPLMALLTIETVLVVFALIAVGRVWSLADAAGRFFSLWAATALFIVSVYPGRAVVDLAWVLVPLWGLAAGEIARLEIWQGDTRRQSAILAGVLVVLMASVWVNLAAQTYLAPGDPAIGLRWLVVAGGLMLSILSVSLVGVGWGAEAAIRGLYWGFGAAMIFGMVTGTWGTSPRDAAARRDIWTPGAGAGQLSLLAASIDDLGEMAGGRPDGLDLAVLSDAPSVQWALRDYPLATFEIALTGDDLPSLIVADETNQDFRLASAYRGEDFVWSVTPYWEQMTARDWLTWWLFRQAPVAERRVILWARAGLFPSGEDISLENAFPPEVDPNAPPESEIIPEEEVDVNGQPVK